MGQSLAVKVRPQFWAEVIGQGPIISILSKQIATKSFKNSYLFSGPSGCGKTTVARLFSKNVNNGEGEPIEIDAASNNGIDSIRAIINDSQQVPIDCDYKVYIIDECHQLTKAAWDSALKLIEEPPMHAIFIFCTTNPLKVPETILSRVQRFDFKRVSRIDIADRLEFICNEDLHCEYERGALERIAALSEGLVREAISKMEMVLDYSNKLTISSVYAALGVTRNEHLINLINSLVTKDENQFLVTLDALKSSTTDMCVVYHNLLETAIDYSIYCKLGDIEYTSIPSDCTSLLDRTYESKLYLIVERLMRFVSHINDKNVEAFLKVISLEMLKEQ